MGNIVNTIFKQPVIGATQRKPDASQAAQGFTAIFASMLAAEMRKAMVGQDKGPLGIGGAGGDIYGALFDQAMGKTLARSAAMKPLNALLMSELGGAGKTAHKGAASSGKLLRTSVRTCSSCETTAARSGASATPAPAVAHEDALPSDDRGPVLMPPLPGSLAPILPPPSPLES